MLEIKGFKTLLVAKKSSPDKFISVNKLVPYWS